MIPLKDDAPRLSTPLMTYFLLAANVLVFLFELVVQSSGQHALDRMIFQFGVVPVRAPIILLDGGYVPTDFVSRLGTTFIPIAQGIVPIFTSMFLHASWLHLIANMWALWIFGDNVEDHLGRFQYLLLYLLSGIAAALLHTAANLSSTVPVVGASGAIAGIMGAYFVLFPSARVLTLVPFLFVFFLWLPAWLVLGYWLVVQFLSGAATALTRAQSAGGIAFWAHVGGFFAGMLLIKLLPSKPRRYKYYGI